MIAEDDLLGARLQKISYYLFEWEEPPQPGQDVDEATMGVALSFDRLEVALTWRLEPPNIERLEIHEPHRMSDAPLIREVDVSARWSNLIGMRVIAASWALHETNDGMQPWALTFAFEGSDGLLVALGEIVDGHPTYLPDSLVVTSSRDVGLSYRPSSSACAAWSGV